MIDECRIADEAAKIIYNVFHEKNNIKQIDFSNELFTNIGEIPFDNEEAKKLCKIFTEKPQLSIIDTGKN